MIKKTFFAFSMLFLLFISTQLTAATGYAEISWGDLIAGGNYGSEPPNYYTLIDSICKPAPVHFPVQTGTVKSIRVRAKDESSGYEITVKLFRVKNSSGGGKELVYVVKTGVSFSSSSLTSFTVNTLSTPGADAINNGNYSWVLFISSDCPGSYEWEKFYSLRIEYQY